MPELRITPQHLERDAYLYIRQSTLRQVLENTESTQRQYALRDRALSQGWPLERIHVLDSDLGKSGSHAVGRDGFQKLVSLLFPRRIRKGLNKGDLHWVRAGHSRILQVLHNPRYAGAFVYGRVRSRRLPDGRHSTTKVPRSEWQFVIPGMHADYISWEQFEANQKRLAENALGFGGARKSGPAREGPALLQGRVLCGICGERMGVHYNLADHQLVPTMSARKRRCGEERKSASVCPAVSSIGW